MRKLIAPYAFAALVALFATPVAGQTVREHLLGARGFVAETGAPRTVTSTDGSSEARAVVQRIVGLVGTPFTSYDVRASKDVANAVATTEQDGRDRLILYNPDWMKAFGTTTGTDWSRWVVLAHEVGHHVAFHMDPAFPNHEAELQADYFAGFTLHKLGAPLSDVLLSIAMVASDVATSNYPSKAERVAQIKRGWEAAATNERANVIPAVLPIVTPVEARPAAPVRPEQRVALLIGNTNYRHWGIALRNPKNDVIAVGRQLRSLGFSTTIVYDATADQIATSIDTFRSDAAGADWAVFYYAGTGIEVEGTNYMIPIEADDRRYNTFTAEYPRMRLTTAFQAVRGAKRVRLVITDACRVDPADVVRAARTSEIRNFKVIEPPTGVLVAYSTAAGQFARDGAGENSPYAMALVDALKVPGIELAKVFRNVSASVSRATHGVQVPTVIGNWPDEDVLVSR